MKKLGIVLGLLVATLFATAPSASAQSVDVRFGTGNYGYGRNGVSIDVRIGDRRGCDHRGRNCNHGDYRRDRNCDHRGSYCNHGDYRRGGCDNRGGDCNRGGYDGRYDRRGGYGDYRGHGGYDHRCDSRCNGGYDRGYDRPSSVVVIVTERVPVYDRYGRICDYRNDSRRVTAYWNPRLREYTYIDRFGNERIVDVRW